MIKSETVTREVIVCDLCGKDTFYTADQAYSKQPCHFCRDHEGQEVVYQYLLKDELPELAQKYVEALKKKLAKTQTGKD